MDYAIEGYIFVPVPKFGDRVTVLASLGSRCGRRHIHATIIKSVKTIFEDFLQRKVFSTTNMKSTHCRMHILMSRIMSV